MNFLEVAAINVYTRHAIIIIASDVRPIRVRYLRMACSRDHECFDRHAKREIQPLCEGFPTLYAESGVSVNVYQNLWIFNNA